MLYRVGNVSKSNIGKETREGSGLTGSLDRPGVYRARHDPDGPATVSESVIEAIADVADVDPTKTVIPLAERIDPDALDALFATHEGDVEVTFKICGLEVLVQSDGRIRIEEASTPDAR